MTKVAEVVGSRQLLILLMGVCLILNGSWTHGYLLNSRAAAAHRCSVNSLVPSFRRCRAERRHFCNEQYGERSEQVLGRSSQAGGVASLFDGFSIATFAAGISRSGKSGKNTSTLPSVASNEIAPHFARRGTLTLLNRVGKKLMWK